MLPTAENFNLRLKKTKSQSAELWQIVSHHGLQTRVLNPAEDLRSRMNRRSGAEPQTNVASCCHTDCGWNAAAAVIAEESDRWT